MAALPTVVASTELVLVPTLVAPAQVTIDRTSSPEPEAATPTPTPSTPDRMAVHEVGADETVGSIAEAHGLQVATLLSANGLANGDAVHAGQLLNIPPRDGLTHVVAAGETLRWIAARFGVTVPAIIAANDLPNPDLLPVGTHLFLPGASETAVRLIAPPVSEAAPSTPPRKTGNQPAPPVSARAIAVVDGESGTLLFGNEEHTRAAPASITKIATTLVALERAPDWTATMPITISGSAMAARDGSSIMGLEPGQSLTLRTLLFGMMLPSGNDAAEQVAVDLAGSRGQYVEWMNQLVASLDLADTHFQNPSGLNQAGHYSSPYDMALLGRSAMQHERFRLLASSPTFAGEGFSFTNLNRLLGRYDGADGVKIGYTDKAGKTIVASATRGGHRVYVSLFHSLDLPGDSEALLDWVWNNFSW